MILFYRYGKWDGEEEKSRTPHAWFVYATDVPVYLRSIAYNDSRALCTFFGTERLKIIDETEHTDRQGIYEPDCPAYGRGAGKPGAKPDA